MPDEHLGRLGRPFDGVVGYRRLPEDVLVVPTGAASTSFVMSDRGTCSLGDITLTRASLRFSDKVWANELATRVGLNVPATWVDPAVAQYPVFVKGTVEGHNKHRQIALGPDNLPESLEGLLMQEYIAGHSTLGVAFLAMEGHVIASHSYEEVHSWPQAGGIRRLDPE